ncbi:MAG: two-CW domain-containing protein [Bacillota bacterium]
MIRINCWEYKKCGRQPGGEKVKELGVCPAAADESCHDMNGGKNGGRICWAIAGTLCGGIIQGSMAEKEVTCLACEFFRKVKDEEGLINFKLLKPGQTYTPRK